VKHSKRIFTDFEKRMLGFKHAFFIALTFLAPLTHAVDLAELAQDPQWHLLLHYESKAKKIKSLADGEGFFLSPEGRHSPLAELRANQNQLMRVPAVTDPLTDPRCRFPLRYQWLRERLKRDDLPPHDALDCPAFHAWKNQLGTQAVWLDFASSYTNNPASMFGHTFLRLERQGPAGRYPDLLHYTINFAAETSGEDGGLVYTIKGLFGGYPGVFSTVPFYHKVQEYNHIESRDVWEYPLALSEAQQQILMDHLWEMGATYFRYYFLDENCSYFLLMLLEAVDGQSHFRSQLPFFTVPMDTLRVLKKKTNWVGAPQYRPSLEKRFYHAHRQLTAGQQKNWRQWMVDQQPMEPQKYDDSTMAAMLDTALLYHAWQEHHHARTPWQKELLLQRSQYPPTAELAGQKTPPPDPLQGHGTSRLSLGYRAIGDTSYAQLEVRGAYHDLLDRPVGFDALAQVEMLRGLVRYRVDDPQLRLDRLQILEIISLYPYRRHDRRLSWNVSTGYETLQSEDCRDCGQLFLQAGPGLTLARVHGRRLFFANLINAKIGIAPWNRLGLSAKPQWIGIAQWDVSHHIRLQAQAQYTYDVWGPLDHEWKTTVTVAWDVHPRHQLRPFYAHQFHQQQWGVNWLWYF
jgi:hypothetical protein